MDIDVASHNSTHTLAHAFTHTHTHMHMAASGKDTKLSHSDHLFICRSPISSSTSLLYCFFVFFNDLKSGYASDRLRPPERHVPEKISLRLLLFCMRQSAAGGGKKGARGHISPLLKSILCRTVSAAY